MDFNKIIREQDMWHSLLCDQSMAINIVWLRDYPVVVEEKDREWWMPLIQKFKYPDVSEKYFYDYGAEEREKLKKMQEESYPLRIENHFTTRQLFDVCLMYLAEISDSLLMGHIDNNQFAKKYSELWNKNTDFLLNNVPDEKREFVKYYLNYFIEKMMQITSTQNGKAIGEILKTNGLEKLKK